MPYAFFVERERAAGGAVVDVATILLTNRECTFTCLMCDLWVNTLDEQVPAGAIRAQLDHALSRLPPARQLKLYNAGSFFDAKAIPPDECPAILERMAGFDRLIVEAHPALIGARAAELARALDGRLEVAMGLETAHPEILARLNKRMTLDDFRAACGRLAAAGAGARAFVLVRPPWMGEDEGVRWAVESVRFARDCGVGCTVLIATRGGANNGNGAMDALARSGEFAPPALTSLERAFERGLAEAGAMRVFVDLWDAKLLRGCPACKDARIARMDAINLTQVVPAAVTCPVCA